MTKAPRPPKEKTPETQEPPQPVFDIHAKELPEWIDQKAFRSGGYPHKRKLKRKPYDKELHRLQIELLKMLDWVKRANGIISAMWRTCRRAAKSRCSTAPGTIAPASSACSASAPPNRRTLS